MNHALIIARRELRERSFVFIAAAVLAVVPFVFAMLPVGRRLGPTTMVAGAASLIAPVLTLGLAVILGASIVGRELSERRLSFYFARPTSAISIWSGKVIAALMLIAGTFGIAILPAFAFAYREWDKSVWPDVRAYTLGAALVLFLLAHFVSVIVRSRSALAIIDLLLAIAAALTGTIIVRPLFNNFAFTLGWWTIVYLVVSLCVTILVAGAWQLSRGRTDPRANHRELSRATWLLFGSLMVLGGAYVAWVFSAKPSDLTKAFAQQAPGGEWFEARGEVRMRGDFQPVFIVNRHSGEWLRFPEARWNGATFTRTGTAAFAIQPFDTATSRAGELIMLKLGRDRARIETGITASEPWVGIALSDDQTRVAFLDKGTLSITDLPTRALLASVRLPVENYVSQLFFTDPNTVRIYRRGEDSLRVYEFDVAQRRLALTGQVAIKMIRQLQVAADGSTLLVRTYGHEAKIYLADARTAQIRRTIDTTDPAPSTLLADGRIAVISNGVLRLFDNEGTLQREVVIGNVTRGWIIDLGRPDKLIVSAWRGGHPTAWNLMVIDIQRGVIEREEQNARYENALNWLDPRIPEPNRTSELAIMDSAGRVWRWNALTGEKTKLLGS